MKKFWSYILGVLLCLSMTLTSFATVTSGEAYHDLKIAVETGSYTGSVNIDYAANKYKTSGGGYALYTEVSGSTSDGSGDFINESVFSTLTSGAKQQFLKDELAIASAMAADTKSGTTTHGVTDDTVTSMTNVLQQKSGMGAQLIATLLQDVKPDFVTANRILKPFNGVMGTIMGVLSIGMIALLGGHMALDLAFINNPSVEMMFGGAESGGDNKEGFNKNKLISRTARYAVKVAESGGENGGRKSATWAYFGAQWKELLCLCIAILYLVSGNIYSLIAQIIDLFSGFMQ